MTPEPMTPRVFGTVGMRNAPSFDRILASSNAAPGSARGTEPVATITLRAVSTSAFAPATATS